MVEICGWWSSLLQWRQDKLAVKGQKFSTQMVILQVLFQVVIITYIYKINDSACTSTVEELGISVNGVGP